MSTSVSDGKIEISHDSNFEGGAIVTTLVLEGEKDVLGQLTEGEETITPFVEKLLFHAIDDHLSRSLQYILERAQRNPVNKGTGIPQDYDETIKLTVCEISITMSVHVTLENGLDSNTIRAVIVETTVPTLLHHYVTLIARYKRIIADKDNLHAQGIRQFTECPTGTSLPDISVIEVLSVDLGAGFVTRRGSIFGS